MRIRKTVFRCLIAHLLFAISIIPCPILSAFKLLPQSKRTLTTAINRTGLLFAQRRPSEFPRFRVNHRLDLEECGSKLYDMKQQGPSGLLVHMQNIGDSENPSVDQLPKWLIRPYKLCEFGVRSALATMYMQAFDAKEGSSVKELLEAIIKTYYSNPRLTSLYDMCEGKETNKPMDNDKIHSMGKSIIDNSISMAERYAMQLFHDIRPGLSQLDSLEIDITPCGTRIKLDRDALPMEQAKNFENMLVSE